jgi:hypothetical protein
VSIIRFARRYPVLLGLILGSLLRYVYFLFMPHSADLHLLHTWKTLELVAMIILFYSLTIGLIQLLIPSQRSYYRPFLRAHPVISVWLIGTAAHMAVWLATRPVPLAARIQIDRVNSWTTSVIFVVGLILVAWWRRHSSSGTSVCIAADGLEGVPEAE